MAAPKRKKRKPQLLVECYGLFWRRDLVEWGYPKVRGRLLGKPATRKRAQPVDFREQTGIYVLYENFRVIYVGQAGYGNDKLFDRLKTHLDDDLKGRWNRFSWFGLRWVKRDRGLSSQKKKKHPNIAIVLDHMEAILIASTEPALNRQGGRWGPAAQYIQYEDPETEPDNAGKLYEIWEWVDEQRVKERKAKARQKKKKG